MAGGEGIRPIMLVTPHDIEQFFFDVPGYGSGAQKVTKDGFPGDKFIISKSGPWEMVDQYCVTPNGPWSAGMTKIRYAGTVVWVTHYGGQYPEEVIPFLKLALSQTARTREFVGGRGPRIFPNPEGTLIYVNRPEINDFSYFRGREDVFDVYTGKSVGFHDYWGMSFIGK